MVRPAFIFLFFIFFWRIAFSQTWPAVGGSDFEQLSDGFANLTDLAMGSDGSAYLVFSDKTVGSKLTVKKYDGSGWVLLGTKGFSPGSISSVTIDVSSTGVPYVAFSDASDGGKLSVMKFDGAAWSFVGSQGLSPGIAVYSHIVLGEGDVPYVGYMDQAGGAKLTAIRFNGSAWVGVGPACFTASYVNEPSFALGPGNVPYFGFSDHTASDKASVMRFDGASWVYVGTAGFSSFVSGYHSIAVSSTGTPYFSYSKISDGSDVTVSKFDGTNWVTLGSPGFTPGKAQYLSLALRANVPYLAFKDNSENDQVSVMKFNGSSWIDVGSKGMSGGASTSISLGFTISGSPVMACSMAEVVFTVKQIPVVKYFTGGSWQAFGYIPSLSPGACRMVSCDADNNGNYFVAFSDYSADKKATVCKWNGSSWSLLGNRGFSSAEARWPEVKVSPAGIPYVAYCDYTAGDRATVKRYDGTSWVNVGAVGFATVSQSTIPLALSPSGEPYVFITEEKKVMRFDGSSWVNVGNTNFVTNFIFHGDLIIDPAGVPYISFTEGFSGSVSVMKLNGASWVYVGSQGLSAGGANNTSLSLNSSGELYVCYMDIVNGYKATVRKFDGTNWQTVGSAGFSSGQASYPRISVDAWDVPYVAYQIGGSKKAYVMRYNGTGWELVGSGPISSNEVGDLDFDLTSSGSPMIAYPSVVAWVHQLCQDPVSGGSIGPDQAGCAPYTASQINSFIMPVGSSDPLVFRWMRSTTSSTSGFTAIPGSNSATYTPGILTSTSWYKRLAKSECTADWANAAESNVVQVTVNPLPPAAAGPDRSICPGSSTQIGASPLTGNTYSWTSVPPGFTSVSSNPTVSPAVTTIYTLTETVSATGCFKSNTVTVTVTAVPSANAVPDQRFCNSTATPVISFSGPVPGTVFSWVNSNPSIGLAASGTGDIASFIPENSTSGPLTATITVTPSIPGSCSGMPVSFTITVNLLPYVSIISCYDPVTSLDAKPFQLKGGIPPMPGSVYKVDGNTLPGGWLDPSTLTAGLHSVDFSYTDQNGCTGSVSQVLNVGPANPPCGGTVTDNRETPPVTYRTGMISGKCWMLENLRYGTSVSATVSPQTDNCLAEKYCLPSDPGCTAYGGLYQWDEAVQYEMTAGPEYQGICMPGWHLPTSAEFQSLIDANQGNGSAGYWLTLQNQTPRGFEALLEGVLYQNNSWAFLASNTPHATFFWTSSAVNSQKAVARGMNSKVESVMHYEPLKSNAFPVRCVKD